MTSSIEKLPIDIFHNILEYVGPTLSTVQELSCSSKSLKCLIHTAIREIILDKFVTSTYLKTFPNLKWIMFTEKTFEHLLRKRSPVLVDFYYKLAIEHSYLMFRAICTGYLKLVKLTVNDSVLTGDTIPFKTLILISSKCGHLSVMKYLLEYVQLSSNLVYELLKLSIQFSRIQIIKYYLQQAKFEIYDIRYADLIQLSISLGKTKILQLLLEHTFQHIEIPHNFHFLESALRGVFIPAYNENATEMANILFKYQLVPTDNIARYLVYAYEQNKLTLADLILQHTTSELIDIDIMIRIIEVTYNIGDINFFKAVLKLASRDVIQFTNSSILALASFFGDQDIVIEMLNNGADIHGMHDLSLVHASDAGHLHIVKILLAHGADMYVDDCKPIIQACLSSHIAIVDLYLARDPNVDLKLTESVILYLITRGCIHILERILMYFEITEQHIFKAFSEQRYDIVQLFMKYYVNALNEA